MLVKLTPGITYSFYACSQKCRLALLGPTSVKAERKMLMKLTPEYLIGHGTISSLLDVVAFLSPNDWQIVGF